jgi:hypothetical protein
MDKAVGSLHEIPCVKISRLQRLVVAGLRSAEFMVQVAERAGRQSRAIFVKRKVLPKPVTADLPVFEPGLRIAVKVGLPPKRQFA